jgi:hypothetical protein
MNQKGNILLLIILGLIILALIPVLITSLFWEAKILMQLIMIFIIYTTVRGFLGSGPLVIVVSAVLIYFMVFKYFELFLSLYILQTLLGLGFISTVIWGIGTTMRR